MIAGLDQANPASQLDGSYPPSTPSAERAAKSAHDLVHGFNERFPQAELLSHRQYARQLSSHDMTERH